MGFLRRLFRGGDGEHAGGAAAPSLEDRLAAYVIREHGNGRSADDILGDPYLRNRASEEQRLRLLERPDVIRAIGEDTAAMAREHARD